MRCLLLLFIPMLGLAGCRHVSDGYDPRFAPGTRQEDLSMRLSPEDRVLFRDESMMIVDTPRGTHQLRFDQRGRLRSDFPHGAGSTLGDQ